MVLMSGMDLPLVAVRAQIAGALDIIVQQSRMGDGSRKITRICQVVTASDGDLCVRDLFRLIDVTNDGQPVYERSNEYQSKDIETTAVH